MSIADADRRPVADTDRRARRRAALRVAMRTGDTIATARAWDRLRGAGETVGTDQANAAWSARSTLGRAIRAARYRKLHPQPPAEMPTVTPVPLRRSRLGRKTMAAAALLTLGALIFLAIPLVPPSAAPPPPLSADDANDDTTVASELRSGGRGRLSGAIPPLAQASPSPEPSVTPQPEETEEPEDTPRPRRSLRPDRTRAPSSSGDPNGSAGGTEGGVGSVPGATGNAPGPTLNILPLEPPTLLGDYDRIMFRVVDSRTRSPLGGVCVVMGTPDCDPSRPHTNERGLWWIDLPRGQVATFYDFYFMYSGYFTGEREDLRYTPGSNRNETVFLFRLRS